MNYKVVNYVTEVEKECVNLKEVFSYLESEIRRLNREMPGEMWSIADFEVYEFHAPTWTWRQVY